MSVTGALRSRGAAAVAVSALGGALLALQLGLRGETDIETQVAGQLLAFALFVPAALLCWRGLGIGRTGLLLVVLFAVAFRAAAFAPAPPLSTDLYRYAWDAHVQSAGINPYRYSPSDPALASLRDDAVWPRINLADWRTVYPPGAEASFLAARSVFGTSARATTWLFLIAEGIAVGLLILLLQRLRAPPERVALLAWHPLAVSEIAANGHADALAVLGLAVLIVAWETRRFAVAGAAVAFAALVKLGPALLIPALVRRGGRRFLLVAVAVFVFAYAPYVSVGTGVVGSLGQYVDRQHFGGSLFWLLLPSLGSTGARIVLALGLAAVVAVVALREHDSVEQVARSGLLVLGGVLLAAGYVQPWHALWLLPFLVLTPAPGWLWLTGSLPLLYLFGLERELPDWVRPVVYGPLLAWAIVRILAPRRRSVLTLPPLPSRPSVAAVIPALDEAEALPTVLRELPDVLDEVVVVDGGSRDGTPEAARDAGARVVVERRRGYGRACATGASATQADVIVFLDGDGSDDPAALPALLEPVLAGRAALSLAARVRSERGAQLLHQRLGNVFVSLLMRLVYGLRVRDVPPMRAVRRDALEGLGLREMTYGWPTEMMVKAVRAGLPLAEIEVRARVRRGGVSKISGRLVPSARAGALMLNVMARHS